MWLRVGFLFLHVDEEGLFASEMEKTYFNHDRKSQFDRAKDLYLYLF